MMSVVGSDYVIHSHPPSAMSLVQGYSSDEDAAGHHDAFNLAAVPLSKRFRVQDTPLNSAPHAAPDVLAQVGFFHSTLLFC
jgi:hypothetical protein